MSTWLFNIFLGKVVRKMIEKMRGNETRLRDEEEQIGD